MSKRLTDDEKKRRSNKAKATRRKNLEAAEEEREKQHKRDLKLARVEGELKALKRMMKE